ncbi:reverse transcriptase domain-containing protein [Tanacetum coccineum]
MGFKYNCFLDAYKGYHQIQMTKKDEEKMTFHTDEGVFCYTKMPFGLKNARATYQRLVDTNFEGQTGRNLEAYVDDMVIKSKTEPEMIKDVEETLLTLQKVNIKLNLKKCSFKTEEGKFLGYIVTSEGIRANPEKAKAIVNMPSPRNLKQMQRLSEKLAALNIFLSKAAKKALPCLDTLKKVYKQKGLSLDNRGRRSIPRNEETDNGATNFNGPKEGRRTHGLPISGQRSSQRRSISGKTWETSPNPLRKQNTAGEEQDAPESKTPKNLGTETDIWKLYTDGASNEHGSGAGLILIDLEGAEYSYALRLNFANSNNDAEYEALLAGLRIAAKMKVEKMHAFVDSKLVASQVEGSYEAKSEKTKKYKEKALEMIRSFNNFQISHIPREDNKKADALSKLAAVQCEGLTKGVLIEELNERSVDTVKINAIIKEATRTWMTPIQEYIEHGILPEDVAKARMIREKARNYTIEEGVLYRKSYLGSLLRCIGPQQAKYLIKEIHMGSCGMHDGPRRAVHKAMNVGYFWPSMHRDANNEISSCDSCQVYATVPKLPKNDMISVTSAWPFRKWGMDIVGPLPEAPGQIKYLIVAIDYFTKWIEAKAVTSITGKQVKNFAFDNIVCRFGIPATIITDNGTQLINDPFKSWAEGLGIKLVSTSVYHPQANGAVERANRSIMQGIKTRLHQEGGAWVEELPNVLWAHRTTPKTSNGETPFSLAYGTEAVIPAEIGIPTRRTIQRSDEENEEALRMNLNLLEERREIATIREARRKQQVEKYYNQRVHHKQFKVGEFVLRKNELSKAENTGKLGPKWEGPYEVVETYGTGAYKLRSMEGAEIPRTWHSSNLRKYYM